MKNLRILILLLLMNSCFFVNAQNISKVSGKVLNSKDETPIGNVIILSVADSSFLTGTSFFEEAFEIDNINKPEVLVKLTSLQFADQYIHLKYEGKSDIDLGDIRVDDKSVALDEVEVTAQASVFTTKANGNIEVNVANSILATSASVDEILSKSPSVIVDDGVVSVFGKGEAIIYLNGARIENERISSIQTADILKLEIITNPSAKYDAEGQSVINIITTSYADRQGIKGTVAQLFKISEFSPGNSVSRASLNYRKGKLSLKAYYELIYGNQREQLYTSRERDAAAATGIFSSVVTYDWERFYDNISTYSLGMQYDISENDKFSIQYSGYYDKRHEQLESTNDISSSDLDRAYNSLNNKNPRFLDHSVIANYTKTLDTLGSSLFLGSQYANNDYNGNDFITETIDDNILNNKTVRDLNNLVDQKIKIFSAQLDYTKVFSASNKLDIGAKLGIVENKSVSDFLVSQNGGDYVYDNSLFTRFKYNEKIPAAYLNFSSKINEKLNYGLGVRGELTNYTLTTEEEEANNKITDNYLNIFPSGFLSYKINEKSTLRFSYSSRITRPQYDDLNPAVIYQDEFTSIEGNPNLQPEKSQAFEIGLTHSKFSLRTGYTYSLDRFSAAVFQGENPNTYVLKAINLDKAHSYFTSLTVPLRHKFWTSSNIVSVRYTKLLSDNISFTVYDSRPQVYLYSNNKFNVKNLFKIQLLAWFLGDSYDGIYFRKNRSVVTLGVEKDFLKRALTVRVLANDIFHKNRPAGNYEIGETYVEFARVYNTQYFRLILNYNFGKLKKVSYRNKATGSSEINRTK